MKTKFLQQITIGGTQYTYYDFNLLEHEGIAVSHLPFSIRILVENLLRNIGYNGVKERDLLNIASWQKCYPDPVEIPFHPGRVLMQDFTGVPAVVDLATMRDALAKLGGDSQKINPLVPVDLVVDHSIQVDHYGTPDALRKNVAEEYERNGERYSLLKWAQKNFDNFRVVPPNSGICHQVNLEYLAQVVVPVEQGAETYLYPDSLVGTDSHTTMNNGIGVIGWGVGGIEAEAVVLGQPYFMTIPEVIGMKLTGRLREGVTATDMVLTITQVLREYNVVEKFVEFFGDGVRNLNATDRATIANMSPEYGATMGFFPVDEKTIEYLKLTNRKKAAAITQSYCKAVGLFAREGESPEYSGVVELDLSTVEPCVAGPSRPQDRIAHGRMREEFGSFAHASRHKNSTVKQMSSFFNESGCVTHREDVIPCEEHEDIVLHQDGHELVLDHGSIVIAAITSCTNTSNPSVLIGAGLLARNAVQQGLRVPSHIKTSIAPGSKVVADYLKDAGLLSYLETLGFYLTGYGCTTCIGNSGPLDPRIEKAIVDNGLIVAAVLSGNRNFEARIHQYIKANYLASPMLVVAYALCGRIDVNLDAEPVAHTPDGKPIYLKDIWPVHLEIASFVDKHVHKEFFQNEYGKIFQGDDFWNDLHVAEDTTFSWDEASNYIKEPPYFDSLQLDTVKPRDIVNARALLLMGDSVTTDHISPAGAIPESSPAGRYLLENGVQPHKFNSYGSRRGNHEVMIRGTFGNVRLKNHMVAPKEGSRTIKFPENKEMYIYDAAAAYQQEKTPLIVLAGKEYGTGSSRDWAAKGTNLLGVRAVIAESFERIHRSNLVGMGVLPLQFKKGESWKGHGIDGSEFFAINGIANIQPGKTLQVQAVKKNGREVHFNVIARLNTEIELQYFEHGGILPYVLRKLATS